VGNKQKLETGDIGAIICGKGDDTVSTIDTVEALNKTHITATDDNGWDKAATEYDGALMSSFKDTNGIWEFRALSKDVNDDGRESWIGLPT
jgi:hypothetical protein